MKLVVLDIVNIIFRLDKRKEIQSVCIDELLYKRTGKIYLLRGIESTTNESISNYQVWISTHTILQHKEQVSLGVVVQVKGLEDYS